MRLTIHQSDVLSNISISGCKVGVRTVGVGVGVTCTVLRSAIAVDAAAV
jgi:hypothetical protein